MPTHSTPKVPHTPWTEMAPTGSSILNRFSMTSTDSITKTPAIRPMTADHPGRVKAQGAVMATSPASMPLAIIPGSGLPPRT